MSSDPNWILGKGMRGEGEGGWIGQRDEDKERGG